MVQRTKPAGDNNKWSEVFMPSYCWPIIIWFGALLMLSGCTTPEPPSPIVQKLEAAGAGDLKNASADSIQQWLGPRRELAIEVENMCKPARAKGLANWADTTEGRICSASAQLTFFRYTSQTGDGKTYKSGTR
jgi:hypothetical protein